MFFFEELITWLARDREAAAFLAGAVLATARVYAVLRTLPVTSGRIVPFTARFALAIVLALVLGPGLPPGAAPPPAALLAFLVLKEALVGFILGFAASLPLHFLEQSGHLIDVSRGGVQSQLLSPTGEETVTPMAGLFFLVAALFFFLTPVGAAFFSALAKSFDAVPLVPASLVVARSGRVLDVCARTAAALFLSSVMLAFPVMLLVLLADLMVGVLGRFAPGTGSYFLALPVRTAAGIYGGALVLLLAAPVVEGMFSSAIDAVNKAFGL